MPHGSLVTASAWFDPGYQAVVPVFRIVIPTPSVCPGDIREGIVWSIKMASLTAATTVGFNERVCPKNSTKSCTIRNSIGQEPVEVGLLFTLGVGQEVAGDTADAGEVAGP